MRKHLLAVAVIPFMLAGCAAEATPASQPAAPPVVAKKSVDAGAVVKKLAAADMGVKNAAVQDEDSDPNNLLGRPNGYVSRASADLPGGTTNDKGGIDRGLVVEVFADAAAVKARSEYLQGLFKAVPMLGSEWHYVADRVLVRVSGKVKPSLAKRVGAVVAKM